MKKTIMFTVAIAISTVSCAQKLAEAATLVSTTDYSEKSIETKEVSLNDFSAVHSSAAIKVVLKKGSHRKAVINSNVMQYVATDIKNGVLSIHYHDNKGGMKNASTEVTIFTPEFSSLSVSSASTMTVEDGFKADKLNIELSSAGKITGSFEANILNIEASSASKFDGNISNAQEIRLDASSTSKINLNGSAQKVMAEASSTAKINIENLKYQTIEKDESSMGKIITR